MIIYKYMCHQCGIAHYVISERAIFIINNQDIISLILSLLTNGTQKLKNELAILNQFCQKEISFIMSKLLLPRYQF